MHCAYRLSQNKNICSFHSTPTEFHSLCKSFFLLFFCIRIKQLKKTYNGWNGLKSFFFLVRRCVFADCFCCCFWHSCARLPLLLLIFVVLADGTDTMQCHRIQNNLFRFNQNCAHWTSKTVGRRYLRSITIKAKSYCAISKKNLQWVKTRIKIFEIDFTTILVVSSHFNSFHFFLGLFFVWGNFSVASELIWLFSST